MKNYKKRIKGFTLIELLVVISIISFLSSVVFGALGNARLKARDAAIISELKQFQILLNLEFNENKSYAYLQPGTWYPVVNPACTGFLGNYATQATAICKKIIGDAADWFNGGGYKFIVGNCCSAANSYSVAAELNSSNQFYCVGSSGSSYDPGTWNSPGCYNNP